MKINSKFTKRLLFPISGLVLFLTNSIGYAAQPVTNGNFETGDLSGWFTDSSNGATVDIVSKGSCYSANDTTKINIRGQYAAQLRANGAGDTDSIATLRSDAFNAGDGFAFIALSESTAALEGKEPTKLVVEILDGTDDSVIASQAFSTGQATLSEGCPSHGEAGHFTSHYFSTRAYRGQGIKIQFKQSTRIKGSAYFTLIDQIVMFNQGEHPAFHSRPRAQAGMKLSNFGTPMLTSEGSFDPDHKLFDLGYTWYVNDDVYALRNPCIHTLENGNYAAVLYVNDGHHAMSDSVSFHINQLDNPIAAAASTTTTVATEESETNVVTVSDPECDVQVALYDDDSPVEVPVNDPNNLYTNTAEQTVVDNLTTPDEQRTGQTLSTELTNNAYSLRSSGIVWKPNSDGDGNLVVLTPSHFPNQSVSLIDANGSTIETADSVGRTNGDRETYRFDRPGSAYNSNIILRIGNTDYLVTNPSTRVN